MQKETTIEALELANEPDSRAECVRRAIHDLFHERGGWFYRRELYDALSERCGYSSEEAKLAVRGLAHKLRLTGVIASGGHGIWIEGPNFEMLEQAVHEEGEARLPPAIFESGERDLWHHEDAFQASLGGVALAAAAALSAL